MDDVHMLEKIPGLPEPLLATVVTASEFEGSWRLVMDDHVLSKAPI
jgi:hypothetical protein